MRLLFILLICPLLAFGQNISFEEQDVPVYLPAGWSMFGYSCMDSKDVAEAFSGFEDQIVIVKDGDGNPYLPEYGYNGLGPLQMHRGYQIKLTEAITDFQFCPFIVPIDTPFDCYVINNDFAKFLSDDYPEIESLVADSCLNTIAANNVYDLNTDGIPHILNDMDGLQYFTNMSEMGLFLSDENLTSLPDLSSMKNLWHLQIGESDYLTSLPELSSLNNLMELSIWDNDALTVIPDLSSLTNLVELSIYNNNALTVIPDLSSLTNLVELDIWGNDSLKCVMGYPEHLTREEQGWPPVCWWLCMDSTACNYNPEANMEDENCDLGLGYDCEGNFKEYVVGMQAEGGIVFYVDSTGEKGLVAALEDLGRFEWGCYGESVNGAYGQAIGTGYQNTLDIVNQGCTTENGGLSAAKAALDAEINGYSDWYIPSEDELKEIYYTIGHRGTYGNIGSFNSTTYWSSTEANNNEALWVGFDTGAPIHNKNLSFLVRPIRAFGYTQGCIDSLACNFNPEANMADGSCEYAEEGYDCEGNEITYQVGDLAQGGIVFYVDETGQHGLVAATEDLGDFEWGCYGESVNGAYGQAIGTGYQNTLDIVNQGCTTENGGLSAAKAALDAEINGYSDWYLPSRDELKEIYYTIGNGGSEGDIGGFGNNWYWYSSENNNNSAWFVYFYNGVNGYEGKYNPGGVRVIRAFGDWTYGCMDSLACNYNPEANMADGSCEYSELGYDCEGNEITYQVGEFAQGGIVFYVDETGQHGLVAAMEDLDGNYEWGCYEESVNGADGITIGTGYQNTLDIANQGCTIEYGGITGARATLDYQSQGFDDWYLPSLDELLEMYSTISQDSPNGNLGGFHTTYPYYLSSSEQNIDMMWDINFNGGHIGGADNKYNSIRVRAIRSF